MAYFDNVELKDKNGDIHYPRTKTNSIYDDNENRLDNLIENMVTYDEDVISNETVLLTDAELLGGKPVSYYDINNMPDTIIQSNEDLNNYVTPGLYRISNGTIALTIINTPYTASGFKFIVEYLSGTDVIMQTVKAVFSPFTYQRTARYNISSGIWEYSDWINQLGFRFYSDVTALGLSSATCTMSDIYNALPNNSILYANFDKDSNSNLPNNSEAACLLRVERLNSNRTVFTCHMISPIYRIYTGYCHSTSGWNGWYIDGIETNWREAILTGAFNLYTEDIPVIYKKVGNTVYLKGAVVPSSTITANSQTIIFVLPSGYRPQMVGTNFVCQGSGMNRFMINIPPNGNVMVERYGTSSNIDIPSGTWLSFNVSFVIN